MHSSRTANPGPWLGRGALWLCLAIWTISLLRRPLPELGGSLIHPVNLAFHEAGHVVFAPLGSFMMSLGGSLFQLIVPLACAWALLFQQEDPFGASVCGWRGSTSTTRLPPASGIAAPC